MASGADSKLFEATHKDYPEFPLACRVYESSVGLEANDFYLKVLRHLGKKHASIVNTWDMFIDESSSALKIFVEYCGKGTLETVVKEGSLEGTTISLYSLQLLRGMDFLGDIGIAHRDIRPKNCFIKEGVKDHLLKISNFRRAITYWNVQDNDVTFLPCINVKQLEKDGENYQAPEVYGDEKKEEFDPVIADTWSYGAVIYHMASKGGYPFKVGKPSDDLEKEVTGNIDKLSLDDEGKEVLKGVLTTKAAERMPLSHADKSKWFDKAKKVCFGLLVGCFQCFQMKSFSFFRSESKPRLTNRVHPKRPQTRTTREQVNQLSPVQCACLKCFSIQ